MEETIIHEHEEKIRKLFERRRNGNEINITDEDLQHTIPHLRHITINDFINLKKLTGLEIRFTEVNNQREIDSLNEKDIGNLISLTALIRKIGDRKLELLSGSFVCVHCKNVVEIEQTFPFLSLIEKCPECGDNCVLDWKRSIFTDHREILLGKEDPEIRAILRGTLVDYRYIGSKPSSMSVFKVIGFPFPIRTAYNSNLYEIGFLVNNIMIL